MSSAAPVLLQGEDPCKSTASVALHEERRLTALQRWRGRKKAQSCPSAADGTNQPLSQSSPVVCSHKRARGVALQRLGDKRAKLSSSGRNSALPSGGVAVCENRGSNADGRSVAGSQAMHKEPGAVERGLIVRSGTVVRLRAGANDGRHFLDNVPTAAYTLPVQRDCRHCGARKIVYGTIKSCCSEGAIRTTETTENPPSSASTLWRRMFPDSRCPILPVSKEEAPRSQLFEVFFIINDLAGDDREPAIICLNIVMPYEAGKRR